MYWHSSLYSSIGGLVFIFVLVMLAQPRSCVFFVKGEIGWNENKNIGDSSDVSWTVSVWVPERGKGQWREQRLKYRLSMYQYQTVIWDYIVMVMIFALLMVVCKYRGCMLAMCSPPLALVSPRRPTDKLESLWLAVKLTTASWWYSQVYPPCQLQSLRCVQVQLFCPIHRRHEARRQSAVVSAGSLMLYQAILRRFLKNHILNYCKPYCPALFKKKNPPCTLKVNFRAWNPGLNVRWLAFYRYINKLSRCQRLKSQSTHLWTH